ncbi:putative Ig domain-containing protein [Laspinema sp. D1]|uniref:Ig domain-containing protein n=1 Tax=Laspinema palackyanum D2a TaxID=2953684 RepID=A0ABT2MSI1_9CYAN|nr:putative Ig domain-containing protein [Laspinema sp. D2a]
MAIAFQGAYFQNFDSLPTNGRNHTWTNHSTIPGWYLFRQPAPGIEISVYDANHGSSNRGSFYSYGLTDESDRALGGIGSRSDYFDNPATGTIAGWIAFAATNNTGLPINSITLNFDGEQWRNGGSLTPPTRQQTMRLEYGLEATFDTVTTWTMPGGNFNFTSPKTTGTVGEVNGNIEGLVPNLGGTIHDLTWDNNQTLWIRWVEVNDVDNDHGLAIDNFSLVWYSAIITESDGITNVTEGGTRDTYTVVLTNPPQAEVTITVNPDNQTTTGVNSLTFTPQNWNVPQTVEISAIDDNLVEGLHTGTITHTAISTDPNYNGIKINSVTANITDNDSANNPPGVVNAIADLTTTVSTLFNFTIPQATFNDPDGHPLSYSATLENGSDLPPWLLFDTTTRTFSGTPLENHLGSINIKVTASDGSLSVSDIFTLAVSAVTPNPEVEGKDSTESEANPPESEANPPELEANPPELEANPPELEANPPESKANFPDFEGNTPEFKATNFESEVNNPKLEANNPELTEDTPKLEANNPELTEDTPKLESNNPVLETNIPELKENSLLITDIGSLQFRTFGPIGPSYFKGFLANMGVSSSLEVNLSNIFEWIATLEELSPPPLSSSNLSQVKFAGEEKSSYNSLIGTPESDLIQANYGDNSLEGLGGNDSLFGGESNDIIQGNPGDDFIKAGSGINWFYGGEGDDTLVGASGIDILYGNEDNDLMYAGDGNNFLYGNQGNDTLVGEDGDDVFYGGKNDDLLIGGSGNDWLFGDLGNDVLLGGAGQDRFIIRQDTGPNLILDFTDGEDLIGLLEGLNWDDLTLIQGNNSTFIYAGDELLAILNEVDISLINQEDFFGVG